MASDRAIEDAGSEELFHGGNGVVDGAAAAAGERVGFEARDARALEPFTQGRAGWWRAEEGGDRGFEEDIECR